MWKPVDVYDDLCDVVGGKKGAITCLSLSVAISTSLISYIDDFDFSNSIILSDASIILIYTPYDTNL